MSIRLNGVAGSGEISFNSKIPDSTARTFMETSTIYELKKGDYLEVFVYQNSGAPLNVENRGGYSPEFMIAKVGE